MDVLKLIFCLFLPISTAKIIIKAGTNIGDGMYTRIPSNELPTSFGGTKISSIQTTKALDCLKQCSNTPKCIAACIARDGKITGLL